MFLCKTNLNPINLQLLMSRNINHQFAMAASIWFSGPASVQHTRQALNIHLSRKKHDHVETKRLQRQLCTRSKALKKPREVRRLNTVVMSVSNSSISINPSPSDTIKQFYECINEKNLNKLAKFISSDCFFEELSFFKPFQGRKEVLQFYEQLFTSMGENIEFVIVEVCEGDNTAGVNWHMEWKKNRIPFTRGCSFYELSSEGKSRVIRKAQVVTESPIKPGPLVLGLLKIVTSLFDAFPEATEWCLRSSHVILQLLLRIYKIFLGPLINPILAFYTNLGNFIARLLSFTLVLISHISKFFNH